MIKRRISYTFLLIVLTLTTSASLFAQSWGVWGTTPVFDGGRVMPENSFAQQIVKEICGSTRPLLVRDDSVLVELNRVIEAQPKTGEAAPSETPYPFLIRRDDILSDFSSTPSRPRGETSSQNEDTSLPIHHLDRNRAERILRRIQFLVPLQGRRVDANELLLSWMGEPEIWEYIPIFSVPESDYREEVLGVPLQNSAKVKLRRVSVFQLRQSSGYQNRLAEMERRRQQRAGREIPSQYDQITDRLDGVLRLFQELTFHPSRHRPTRMIEILHNAVELSGSQRSSYAAGIEAWGYLLTLGGDPRFLEQSDDEEQQTHPTADRWHAISRKIVQLAGAFDRFDSRGRMVPPNLPAVERQFELLIKAIEENLAESEAIMEQVYPGTVYRVFQTEDGPKVESFLPRLFSESNLQRNKETINRIALNYYFSLKTLRKEIDAAYLALYDNGRSMRILPVNSGLAVDGSDTTFGVQPWGTMQTVLTGGDAIIRRFFDPSFQLGTSARRTTVAEGTIVGGGDLQQTESEMPIGLPGLAATDTVSTEGASTTSSTVDTTTVSNANAPETLSVADERYEIDLFTDDGSLAGLDTSASSAVIRSLLADPINRIRSEFNSLMAVYIATGRDDSRRQFNDAATGFQQALRSAADRVEILREQFANQENPIVHEMLAKTAYPVIGATKPEYRYFRLAPFFWMWIFAGISIGFVVLSMLVGKIRLELSQNTAYKQHAELVRAELGRDGEPGELGYSNFSEECTLWTGILFLMFSILITFIGGMMRAWISGWAPVTNMYETVVLMAFSASLLGLWYALAPLVHPALMLAWRWTSFPTLKHLSKISKMFSKPKQEATPIEDDGRYSMRQAAEDFGVHGAMYGGVSGGMGSVYGPDNLVDSSYDPEEERQLRQAKRALFWQSLFFLPRVVLMVLIFFFVVRISYGEYAHDHGLFAAAFQMLAMHDIIDWIVVIASIGFIVWLVPHLLLAVVLFPLLLLRPSSVAAELGISSYVEEQAVPIYSAGQSEMSSVFHGEVVDGGGSRTDNSGSVWIALARNRILDRKPYLIVAAVVTLLAGLAAHFNSSEFNPNIRPLVAVLRSNFWLTVHVIAIIVSYAAAMIAWGMSCIALGSVIFGRYRHENESSEKLRVRLPTVAESFAPGIRKLLLMALVLLALGTILGARWADYSWGRFWSWDPKEVWALITILFFAIVLHGRIARFYGQIGVMVGALFGSIAVIVTWYGINFVFKGSIHSYGGGAATNATIFMYVFIALNVLWGLAALFRYAIEIYGRDSE